ncbi:MAG TPA: hypothetical protein VKL40_09655 [Candidatus Angelobacter sp.]|nr:hypothetical protein [Candidatus Angelobacter sp.]
MHYSLRSLVVGWFAAVLIGSLLACGGDSTTTPPGSAHLYSATGNEVFQLALPLKSTSTPTVTVTSASINNASAVAVDANGNVAVGDASGNITILNAPITNSSTPSATFKNGTATSVAHLTFNSAGDLFATTFSNTVNVFTHPFSSASTPSQVITDVSLALTVGVALDSNRNLIVANGSNIGRSNLSVFAPPYTAAPIVTAVAPGADYRHMAINSTQLFVVTSLPGVNGVDVYNLPITAASTPAFLFTSGIFNGPRTPNGIALDGSGNVLVGHDSGIAVFSPPFSSASDANLDFRGVPGAAIAIGK